MKKSDTQWHHFPAEKPLPGEWVAAIWHDGTSPLYGMCKYFAKADEDWFEQDGSECTDPDFWTPIPAPPKELDIYE